MHLLGARPFQEQYDQGTETGASCQYTVLYNYTGEGKGKGSDISVAFPVKIETN